MTPAWTLGEPTYYLLVVRIPGNAKAPGGYAFRTMADAANYANTHEEAARYRPFQIYLPGTFEECTTTDFATAARARHAWHSDVRDYMPGCGVCTDYLDKPLDCALLIVEAPVQPRHSDWAQEEEPADGKIIDSGGASTIEVDVKGGTTAPVPIGSPTP